MPVFIMARKSIEAKVEHFYHYDSYNKEVLEKIAKQLEKITYRDDILVEAQTTN